MRISDCREVKQDMSRIMLRTYLEARQEGNEPCDASNTAARCLFAHVGLGNTQVTDSITCASVKQQATYYVYFIHT